MRFGLGWRFLYWVLLMGLACMIPGSWDVDRRVPPRQLRNILGMPLILDYISECCILLGIVEIFLHARYTKRVCSYLQSIFSQS